MFARVYARDWAADDAKKAMHIVTALVRHYTDHPSQLPNEYLETSYREGYAARAVCDFVACMTDAYAVKPIRNCSFHLFLTESGECLQQSVKKCMKDAGMRKKVAKKSRAVKDDGRKAASGMAG